MTIKLEFNIFDLHPKSWTNNQPSQGVDFYD